MSAVSAFEELIAAAEDWMESAPEVLVDLLLSGEESPFTPRLSEADKLSYYRAQFFKPDGTPNEIGRQEELQRLGIDGYLKVLERMQKLGSALAPPITGEFP